MQNEAEAAVADDLLSPHVVLMGAYLLKIYVKTFALAEHANDLGNMNLFFLFANKVRT